MVTSKDPEKRGIGGPWRSPPSTLQSLLGGDMPASKPWVAGRKAAQNEPPPPPSHGPAHPHRPARNGAVKGPHQQGLHASNNLTSVGILRILLGHEERGLGGVPVSRFSTLLERSQPTRENLGLCSLVEKGRMIDSACLTRMHSNMSRCNAVMRGDVIERL